jgi:hypothetical protein
MSTAAIVAIIQALVSGVPKLIEMIKAGKDPKNVNLGDFVSTDALDKIRAANKKADDYIENG